MFARFIITIARSLTATAVVVVALSAIMDSLIRRSSLMEMKLIHVLIAKRSPRSYQLTFAIRRHVEELKGEH